MVLSLIAATSTAASDSRRKLPVVSFEQFVKIHKSQLALVPKLYWASLHEKITCNIFDLDKNIEIETKKITYSKQKVKKQVTARVCNKNGIRQDDPKSVFLVQHFAHYHAGEGRELMKDLVTSRSPVLGKKSSLRRKYETMISLNRFAS